MVRRINIYVMWNGVWEVVGGRHLYTGDDIQAKQFPLIHGATVDDLKGEVVKRMTEHYDGRSIELRHMRSGVDQDMYPPIKIENEQDLNDLFDIYDQTTYVVALYVTLRNENPGGQNDKVVPRKGNICGPEDALEICELGSFDSVPPSSEYLGDYDFREHDTDDCKTQSKSAFEKEPREVPFSSASDEKVGSPVFYLSSTPSESLVPEQTRPVSALKSFTDHTSGETGIVSKPAFDKVETKEAQKSGSAVGKPEVSSSTASASAPTSSIFSFGAPANNSNLSNFSSDSRLPASAWAPPVQFSETSKLIFTKSPSTEASSASATNSISAPSTSASNSSPTTLPAASSFPSFNFGATSGAPANSVSTETAVEKVKFEKETSGNQSSLPSNGTAFSFGSEGSNPNASLNSSSSSAGNNSPFGSGSRSLGSTEAALAGTGSTTAAQTAPFKFSSSSSFPAFGTSGAGSVSSGSSPFGSSTLGSLGLSSSSSGSAQFGSLGSGSSSIGFGLWAASGSSMFVASSTSGSSGFGFSTSTIGSFGFGSSAATGSSGFGTSTTGSSPNPGFMFNDSLGSGGPADKDNRRIVKVKHNARRKR